MAIFDDITPGLSGVSKKPFAVTPSDSVDFSAGSRYLYVGGAGDVNLVRPDGTAVLYKSVPAGAYIVAAAKRVNLSSTTATYIIGHE